MRRFELNAVAIGVATAITLAMTTFAAAQAWPIIVPGQRIHGRFIDGRPDLGDRMHKYGFSARAGQRLEFTMRSEDFDAYLEVVVVSGIPNGALAADNDGLGEGTDARIRFTAPHTAQYFLFARSRSGSTGGNYVVTMNERAPASD